MESSGTISHSLPRAWIVSVEGCRRLVGLLREPCGGGVDPCAGTGEAWGKMCEPRDERASTGGWIVSGGVESLVTSP